MPAPADSTGMNIQIEGLNPELMNMVNTQLFSGKKIADLVRLKVAVDRFAGERYVSMQEAQDLIAKFGVEPDIITWGDYFQTEIGSRYFEMSDEDFSRIVDTIRFDLISSALIFTGKDDAFIEMVTQEGLSSSGIDQSDWTEQQQEWAHLFILKQYFMEMKLDSARISAADQSWFDGFMEAARDVG